MSDEQRKIEVFSQIAADNQELMRDIFVAVPARPHDGIAISLACTLSIWATHCVQWKPLESETNGFIEVTRMRIVHDFLHSTNYKYLLMIDNDTEPPIDLPWLLARHDKPIVGSCITSMSAEGRPMLCFTRPDHVGTPRLVDYLDGDKIPAIGLAEVPHVGTGAMLIRRDVLEAFTYNKVDICDKCGKGEWDVPFLLDQEVKCRGMRYGKMREGEDIRFCKQARGKGFKVYVDMESHCGHRKSLRMTFPTSQRDPSLSVEDWIVSAKGMSMKD